MASVVSGMKKLFICYIDEAGCTGNLPSYSSDIQPVFVLCGLIISESSIKELTLDFIDLKRKFNPSIGRLFQHDLDIVKYEIKGAEDIRKPIRKKNRNQKRRSIGFLDKLLVLLNKHNCKILSNIYVKSPEKTFDSISLYTRSMQAIHTSFQSFVETQHSKGMVVADSRTYDLNVKVSHSIFTQKFKVSGDAYPNVIEMPLYGHSDNHVAIQITDILCSALLFPIATYSYCSGHIRSVHVNAKYQILQERYAKMIKALSYSYFDGVKYRSGITVDDALEKRGPNSFFLC